MAVEQCPVSGQITLAQNTVYALPAKAVTILTPVTLEISNTTAFTTVATVATTGVVKVSGLFVRCTTASPLISLRPD